MENRVKTEQRARTIEAELDQMRRQFHSIESTDPEHNSEVNQLRDERKTLESKLAALESRELELRDSAARASELGHEIHALEDLLEEASEDLENRDDAIRNLETSLKRASKDVANQEAGRAREADVLSKRYGTLYRNIEVDDRALQDIVALRDEAMKLKCEEKLKRLNDEAENVTVRRKVGGIPPHLTIFEMGFAGKGRIYYMKGSQRRFRVLNVGAKNTQNAAIEYLRKL
jgi:chromosome segregation ATPase